ncbi:FKBP-type peptidyl-prolyl cis-trans isomerase [Pedobacter soli]|uniref:Peptidyl-prolyl cis-trans isomerase n=1 Tax=Pedobacter soli TaxID=390242 RepID=A0A1G6MDS8_9SPHI|nr:FKBP-type peptidyl-prolyl cis-trans isomerase [Pedobacter soli]SDC53640.1 FKBP-type peptidyl-prolyl cis-trans isomerase [Pedobacter soli]
MNKFTQLSLFTLLLATVIFSSCKKEYESIQSIDDAAIQAYLKKNNLSFEKDTSGYYYKVTTDGTGDVIKNSDSVYYSYTFKTLSGQLLNQTSNVMIPGTFLGYTDRFTINNVSYVFKPIREVLTKLKRGGKATLIMPSSMAFGKNGISFLNIGSNENILVDLGIYTESKVHQIDELEINNFLSANSLTAIKDPSRIRYIITQQGTGDQVLASSTLSVNYTGRLLSGTIFDQTNGTAVSIELANAIKGWGILTNFKAGTKIRLFIPSDLGYGQLGNGTIPGNAVLDFDIEIVSVTN